MKIYKFGGASVMDSEGVKNLVRIIESENTNSISIVVSAMGKTTKALGKVAESYLQKSIETKDAIDNIFQFHRSICFNLFENKSHKIFQKINNLERELHNFIDINKSHKKAFVYDQIVPFGEMLSSTIISEFMKTAGISNLLIDARSIIKTDSNYREAKVDWKATLINAKNIIDIDKITITQGFIGSDDNNFSTSLGLEGSDYSAAIIAYCLNAESVTVWKDVEGILNADPRYFENTTLLNQISFREAIELSYYGATVIHPKTIQPLQHKEIPLYVKNFTKSNNLGTIITKGATMEPLTPCYIIKKNQIFISISALDFSFIVEENMSEIFALISKHKLKVNLIQNSAISFTLTIEDKFNTIDQFLNSLRSKYRVKYNIGVNLYTIRHYNENSLQGFEKGKIILLKQFSRETAQYIIK